MLIDGVLTQNSILETAMHGNQYRKDVILNNIANVDTPGFKKKTVLFEESLLDSMRRSKHPGGQPDLSDVKVTLKQIHTELKYRLDGNNVDIEVEMLDLYETSVRYDVLANSVMNNYKRINSVLTGIR